MLTLPTCQNDIPDRYKFLTTGAVATVSHAGLKRILLWNLAAEQVWEFQFSTVQCVEKYPPNGYKGKVLDMLKEKTPENSSGSIMIKIPPKLPARQHAAIQCMSLPKHPVIKSVLPN
ncbi:hypothetical protein DID88_001372 [Monilinia fructigena]|uniref:Uncharacterized protein n=1 Tax=Monilinia fructigena TaxID=38457 RepID=A0A395IYB2_9HELO|nr:hypothetical protein DID88_001372 [Monilinia fructigena]